MTKKRAWMEQAALDRLHQLSNEFDVVIGRYTDLLFLIRLEQDAGAQAKLHAALEPVRRDMKRLTEEQLTIIESAKGQRQMKRQMNGMGKLVALMLLLLVLLLGSVAVAQETTLVPDQTETLAADATAEVTPIVEPTVIATEPAAPTPAPSDGQTLDVEVALRYLTVVSITALILLVILGGTAIVVAMQGMPKWGRDIVRAGINQGFDQAELVVEATPGNADNELLLDLRERVEELFARIDAKERDRPQPPDADSL